MNDQQAFDKMVTHLFTQKEKAFMKGLGCQYRMANGLRCAVGALIPDEDYSVDFESRKVGSIVRHIPALQGLSVELLARVQSIHDNNRPVDWFSRLSYTCDQLNLDDTVLNTFKEAIPSERP